MSVAIEKAREKIIKYREAALDLEHRCSLIESIIKAQGAIRNASGRTGDIGVEMKVRNPNGFTVISTVDLRGTEQDLLDNFLDELRMRLEKDVETIKVDR